MLHPLLSLMGHFNFESGEKYNFEIILIPKLSHNVGWQFTPVCKSRPENSKFFALSPYKMRLRALDRAGYSMAAC